MTALALLVVMVFRILVAPCMANAQPPTHVPPSPARGKGSKAQETRGKSRPEWP